MSQASIAVQLPAVQAPAKPHGPYRAMVVAAILGAAVALAAAAGISTYRESVATQQARAELARVNQAAVAMHIQSERAENGVITGPFAVGIPATVNDRQVAAHIASERAESAAVSGPFAMGIPATSIDRQVVAHLQAERSETAAGWASAGTPATANDRQVVEHNQSERSE